MDDVDGATVDDVDGATVNGSHDNKLEDMNTVTGIEPEGSQRQIKAKRGRENCSKTPKRRKKQLKDSTEDGMSN